MLSLLCSCKELREVTVSRLEGARLIKLDQSGIEMEVSLRIKNPNSVGFSIYKSSNLEATLNDIHIGRLKLDRKIHVNPNSDDVHTFTLSSDFSQVNILDLPKLLSIGKSRSIMLGIKGELKAGKFFYKKTFPVERREKITL